jgi:hypothetical protein
MCLLLNPDKDLNHLHIKLTLTPCHLTSPQVFSCKSLCKISVGEFSKATGSSSGLFFAGEVFVQSSVNAYSVSVDRSLDNKHSLTSLRHID